MGESARMSTISKEYSKEVPRPSGKVAENKASLSDEPAAFHDYSNARESSAENRRPHKWNASAVPFVPSPPHLPGRRPNREESRRRCSKPAEESIQECPGGAASADSALH